MARNSLENLKFMNNYVIQMYWNMLSVQLKKFKLNCKKTNDGQKNDAKILN